MPTWRDRGAQPLSVTFRVAASSAPSSAAKVESSSYSSGWMPAPTPDHDLGPGEHLDVIVTSAGHEAHTAAGRDRPRCDVRACALGGGNGSTPGRTDTNRTPDVQVMSATRAPEKAGLAATRSPSAMLSAIASPTIPPRVQRPGAPSTSRPNAVLGPSTAHIGVRPPIRRRRPGPRRSVDREHRDAVGPEGAQTRPLPLKARAWTRAPMCGQSCRRPE